jgi:wyosine [tRNA(Phe)-imidazoG37] synthetase (radical SAM superfamily)
MSTFLFDKIVFGPVKSRRLGVSLGINLLPTGCKVCNFNCIYCECGLNTTEEIKNHKLPSRYEVYEALEQKLQEMKNNSESPDVITFAGNGEPTIHPAFASIIDDTIELRNRYFPEAQISVLSNSTMIHNNNVVAALQKIDQNILKIDSAIPSTIHDMNQPTGKFILNELIEHLKSFNGRLIIQTLFTRGQHNGRIVDNTTELELTAWAAVIKEVTPQKVMIYTIERNTPVSGLQKISADDLNKIAERIKPLGIEVQVSA